MKVKNNMNQNNNRNQKISLITIFLLHFLLIKYISLNIRFIFPQTWENIFLFSKELISSVSAFCSNFYYNIYKIYYIYLCLFPPLYTHISVLFCNRIYNIFRNPQLFSGLSFLTWFGKFSAIISLNIFHFFSSLPSPPTWNSDNASDF